MSMNKKCQTLEFRKFLNQGILMTNLEEAGKATPKYERQRKAHLSSSSALVMCAECKIFISPGSMSHHKNICSGYKKAVDVRLIAKPTIETSNDFKDNILATLRNDTIGIICKKDKTILLVGYWAYQKSKKSANKIGVRDSVRKEMRYLAHCYKKFLDCKPKVSKFKNSNDTFLVQNFQVLRNAINNYYSEGD